LTGKSVSDEELKRLYETHSTAAIGKLLGRCSETIRKRLKKLGVAMRPRGSVRTFTPSREELEAEYQNHSMRQIAEKYGVGETVVWNRLKEFGIKLHDYENGGHRLKPGRIQFLFSGPTLPLIERLMRMFGSKARGRVSTAVRSTSSSRSTAWRSRRMATHS